MLVMEADAGTGMRLDNNFMAAGDEFTHGGGHQAHTVFVRFDFLGDTN